MKKLLLAFVAAMLVLCLTVPAAFAATDREIHTLCNMVDRANARIDAAVEKAISTPRDDVKQLLKKVEQITDPVFDYAASIGVTVVCKYDYYWIDGHRVAVDPLRVVNVGTGGTN